VVALVLVLVGAAISVLAFPPFGPGWLIVFGVAFYLAGLRLARSRKIGVALGAVYGLAFHGGVMWWTSELGLIASLPLIVALAVYTSLYAWWVTGYNDLEPGRWLLVYVGGWAVMELFRYRWPLNGLEWGANGYALSDQAWTRFPAGLIGTSGLTILVVAIAGTGLLAVLRRWDRTVTVVAGVVGLILVSAVGWHATRGDGTDVGIGVAAIVQGSTPCPFEHCPPNERYRTYEQHLALTQTLQPGPGLVVWSEGSTGSTNADPVQNPEVGASISAEAVRLDAPFLVGSDRPLSDTEWVNANVVFDAAGEIIGEYHKQHPVPFGEYIPFRPLFEWIPALDQVPRDMTPGDGPVVFDVEGIKLGSVISFEGSFARYAREHVAAGAEVIVVATNEASYGETPASDQLIGMTRMRAAELGVPVIHAAVTGKSTVINYMGEVGPTTSLGAQETLEDVVTNSNPTPYSTTSDLLMFIVGLVGVGVWWMQRSLVGSVDEVHEEE
jgi:apolipoprotein N-acyltransferase